MNIQIMKIYHESFHDVRSHKLEWMKVAFSPILIWALGALFVGLSYYLSTGHVFEIDKVLMGGALPQLMGEKFMGAPLPQEMPESSTLLSISQIIYHIMYFVAMICLYINGYRYALLKEGGDAWITLNLNMRFVKMALYTILITILAGTYLGISAGIIIGAHALFDNIGINVILGILLFIYLFYLMFRLTLYPVVISMDHAEPLKTSWRLMKGNILRLLGLVLLVTLTIMLIGLVGGIVVGLVSGLFSLVSPMLGILSLILWLLFAIFMILLGWAVNSKMLGLVYQELSTTEANTDLPA